MNIRQRKAERHKETLRKLSQEGGNKYCYDCDMRGPLYVVSDFNVLVCSGCSAVHRSFQHKVKGITMSEFTEEEIARFTLGGNDTAEKVWLNTFKGKHPRSGDVLALKDFVRDTFVERRFCDQVAYARLMKAWEDPVAALAAAAPSQPAAAHPLPPPPSAPAKAAVEPQREAPVSAPPQQQQQQQQPPPPPVPAHNVFDDLFAAPVQAPAMPASAAPVATSAAPPPPQQPQQPQKISNLVDDLFASAPPPMPQQQQQQQPQMSGFGGPSYPQSGPMPQQQQQGGFMGSQGFSSGMPQQPFYAYPPQQQQQQFDFGAPQPPMGYAAAPNTFSNGAPFAAPMQPPPQQQQQYPGYAAPFSGPPMQQQQAPWAGMNSAPMQPNFAAPPPPLQQQPSHPTDFSVPPPQHAHASAANDPFKNLGDPSIFAHLGTAPRPPPPTSAGSSAQQTPAHNTLAPAPNAWGQPASAPSQPFAWGDPVPQQQQQQAGPANGFGGAPVPASNASSSPNRSRIQVLGVTKSSQPPTDVPPMWQ